MKLRLRRILFTQRDSKVGCAESYLGNGKRREPRDILRLSSFCLCRGYPCFFRPLCPLRPSVRYGPLPFPAPLPAAAFCSLRPSAFSGPFACCGLLFAATLSPPLCLLRPFPASGQTVITSTPTASSVVLIWAGSWLSVIRMSMSSIEQMRPNPLRPIFDESVSTMLWDAAFIIF